MGIGLLQLTGILSAGGVIRLKGILLQIKEQGPDRTGLDFLMQEAVELIDKSNLPDAGNLRCFLRGDGFPVPLGLQLVIALNEQRFFRFGFGFLQEQDDLFLGDAGKVQEIAIGGIGELLIRGFLQRLAAEQRHCRTGFNPFR
ncbi:hypothetical protein DSECCO2_440560 [anaerobic digester metagenome]